MKTFNFFEKAIPLVLLTLEMGCFLSCREKGTIQTDELTFRTVYPFELKEGEEGFKYRIPSLVVSNEGTVLAFAERRLGGDHSENDIVLKRSFDSGKSWEEEQVIAEDGQNSLNDPCAVVLETGRILLMYQRFPYGYHARKSGWIQMAEPGYDGPRNTKSILIFSDDDGQTWSSSVDITHQVRRPEAIAVGSPGVGIQLTLGKNKGRIILPLYETIPTSDSTRVWQNSAMYSDDNGETWNLSEVIPHYDTVGFGNEAQLVELADTSVMMFARNQNGKFRKVAVSEDGGETWGPMKIDYDLPGTNCMGSVIRYSWPEEGESAILFVSPANKEKRTNGIVRVSYDEGKSWSHSREVFEGSYAYSCLTKLHDGNIGLLFESNREIIFTSFSIDWIKEGRKNRADEYFNITLIDLTDDTTRQVIIDKGEGQYLGHPTTVLLEDNKTIYCVYPKGHGRGAIVMKRSNDAGLTWSDRLPTPKSWETSMEVPIIYRVVDSKGIKRLIMFSGLYPIRMAVSEDDGTTWSELKPIGDFGGIVAMACLVPLNNGKGHYMALFHDDQRFISKDGKEITQNRRTFISDDPLMTLYKTLSYDGGLTWNAPEVIYTGWELNVCEPGFIRSPDGKQIAVLLRENSRRYNSQIIFSDDEGETWTEPRELPNTLCGDRHVLKYSPDGRILATFRDISTSVREIRYYLRKDEEQNVDKLARKYNIGSPTEGDWVAWIGTYKDLVERNEGQYRLRLKDNTGWDTGYPGLELLPDSTFIITTYGHWIEGEEPFILSVRLKLEEIDQLAKKLK